MTWSDVLELTIIFAISNFIFGYFDKKWKRATQRFISQMVAVLIVYLVVFVY